MQLLSDIIYFILLCALFIRDNSTDRTLLYIGWMIAWSTASAKFVEHGCCVIRHYSGLPVEERSFCISLGTAVGIIVLTCILVTGVRPNNLHLPRREGDDVVDVQVAEG
jgi:hypothetical protein